MNGTSPKLTRSNRDRVFGGVCGGLAQYIGHDAVLVRVGFVALTLLAGPGGILLYLFAWAIIPLDRDASVTAAPVAPPEQAAERRRLIGVLLVVAGLVALGALFLPVFWKVPDWRLAGPIVVILIGAALLLWQHDRQVRETKQADTPPAEDSKTASAENALNDTTRPRRRLVRRHHARKIAGVCAGLAEYFNADPALIRIIMLALLFAGGTGLLLYVILWIAMPLEN